MKVGREKVREAEIIELFLGVCWSVCGKSGGLLSN